MTIIRVVDYFEKFPGGRLPCGSPSTVEAFQKRVLEPALRRGPVLLQLDPALGYALVNRALILLRVAFKHPYLEKALRIEALIRVADHFSRFPGGRLRADGPHSGQAFREDLLEYALHRGPVRVQLDGTMGFGSSFLEEAFGGLLRAGFRREQLETRLIVEASHDASLEVEIAQYLRPV